MANGKTMEKESKLISSESPFSVVMMVYKKDNAHDFRKAVESISILQSRRPSEIVLVVDGPIPDELNYEIKNLKEKIPEIKPSYLKENVVLGIAARIGT